MKKLLLVAVMALGFGFSAAAQDVTFGVKGGLNFSNVKVETNSGGASPDGRVGYYVGGLADFGISQEFHIQPEVLVSSEGVDDAFISFVNIPVLAKYYVAEGFNIQAGPQLGILIDAEGGTDGLKSTNFGLSFGAGYELPNGLFFDARYNLGLTDMLDYDGSDFEGTLFSGLEMKTRNFQVGFGYRF